MISVSPGHIRLEADLRKREDLDWLIECLTVNVDRAFPKKALYDVVLRGAGGSKIHVIQEIRAIANLPLKESKELSDRGGTVLAGVEHGVAVRAHEQLLRVGATAAIEQVRE